MEIHKQKIIGLLLMFPAIIIFIAFCVNTIFEALHGNVLAQQMLLVSTIFLAILIFLIGIVIILTDE